MNNIILHSRLVLTLRRFTQKIPLQDKELYQTEGAAYADYCDTDSGYFYDQEIALII